MVRALPQRHPQREPRGAARAQEDRRPIGRHPRPVRGDQQVGRQVTGVLGAELAQSRRAGFLAGLDEDLQVEAEPAAPGMQHVLQRGQVNGALALVIRRSPAIPAVLLDRHLPWVKPGAPAVRLGEHHIGVTVGQHGRQARVLVPVRDQQRPAASAGVVQHLGGRAQPERRRDHFPLQVSQQLRAPGCHPALRPEGHPPRKIRQEITGIEIVTGMGNGKRPGHQPTPPLHRGSQQDPDTDC